MSLLIFLLILSILIVVHEAGHFLTAKRLGVRVEQFALGFGPKIFSWVKDGTEYCLCAIPLGGYVKMAGDERGHWQGKTDEFFSQSVGRRSLIIIMGPLVNYVLAYLCLVVVFMLGYVDMAAMNKVVPPLIGKVVAQTPAALAGIRGGDRVLSINDVTIENWQQMQDEIASSYGRAIHVHVQRQGQEEQVFTINPQMREAKDIFGRTRKVAQIGVQPETEDLKDRLVIRRYNILGAVVHASGELLTITTRTLAALWEIVTGQRSAKEGVTGLIGIFFIVRHAITVGFSFVLYIMAVISASLAIFNLLPMIPLDGGHLALNFLEKMRRRTLSQRTEDLVTRFGLVLIIALAVFVFYVDFERIGLIDRIVGLFRS